MYRKHRCQPKLEQLESRVNPGVVSAAAPVASGPGLQNPGLYSALETGSPEPNNDNNSGKINFMSQIEVFGAVGYIDVEYTARNSNGITEYYVEHQVTNFTGRALSQVRFQLGFGTGSNFGLAATLAGEGLDFDTPDRDTGENPDTGAMSGPFQRPVVFSTLDHWDTEIQWYGGGLGNRMPNFHWFSIDLPDYDPAQMPTGAQVFEPLLDDAGNPVIDPVTEQPVMVLVGYKFTLRTIVTGAAPAMMAPMASNDTYAVPHDQTLLVSAPGVLANDSDLEGESLTAILQTGPSHGSVNLNADGSFQYAPSPGFVGTDSFMYWAFDGLNYSNDATVTIEVQETGTVSGRAFSDADHDGIQDAGETSLTAIVVQLLNQSGQVVASTMTNSSGNYQFLNVALGNYYVKFVKPMGTTFSPQDQGMDDAVDSDVDSTGVTALFTLSANQLVDLDAGLYG